MWCTRWYLPLLLLPFPIAPPYFLVLFILSTTLHARPCFYCVILLSALFFSSCYWPPVPIDTPLSVPWADNITTFSDALRTLMPELPSEKLPSDVPIVDHCWCDVATGDFFEPFNITRWEHESVKRLKTDLERKLKSKENITSVDENEKAEPTAVVPPHPTEPASDSMQSDSPDKALNFVLPWPFGGASRTPSSPLSPTPIRSETKETDTTTYASSTNPGEAAHVSSSPSAPPSAIASPRGSWLRKEYDLRPIGFDLVIDLRWSRAR